MNFPLRKLLSIAWMMVLFAVLPEPCTAQQGGGVTTSPDYALFSMKLNQIPGLMAAEKYNDALKNIEHCVTWMKDKLEKDPRLNQPFEYCHFVRAVCRLQLKEYDAATGEFSKYLGLFPQGRFRRNAIILWADAHAAKDEWNKVVEVILPVFKDPGIKYIEQLAAYQLLGEARFKLEQWKEAIDPLKWLFVNGSYESRTDVASMLAICFIRIDDFETLYKFIPAVFKTPARYDVRLQMTLMEEGDRHYGEGNIDKALLLFRLIYPKTELIMQLQKRTQDLQRQRNEAVQREKADLEVNASVIRKIERALKVYAEQLKQINEVPDYDIELRVRVANCYHELQRFLEAWLLFKQIHKDDPKHKLAQRSLYSAFAAALEMKDIERALKDGYGYLDEYPKGEFWDTVTINLATIHLERTEFEKAIAVCERALKVNPEHLLKDNVLYIIGYSQFMLSNLEGGLASLERIFNEHPQSGFLQYSMYYHALGYLFLQRYTPARQEFASFLNRFKGGPMVEEVSYRIGVAYYGEGNFDKAAEVLQSFLERYPDSINRSEAFAMLADIQGSRGELDEALKNYDNALPPAVNMVQVDYAVMQKSRTLELESRYDEIIALWSGYSAKYKELANFTEAIYWIGSTQKKQNKLEECLNTFYDGIVKYEDDPANHGIDMILRDLESELKELPDAAGGGQAEQRKSADLLRSMKDRLYGEIREAIAKNPEDPGDAPDQPVRQPGRHRPDQGSPGQLPDQRAADREGGALHPQHHGARGQGPQHAGLRLQGVRPVPHGPFHLRPGARRLPRQGRAGHDAERLQDGGACSPSSPSATPRWTTPAGRTSAWGRSSSPARPLTRRRRSSPSCSASRNGRPLAEGPLRPGRGVRLAQGNAAEAVFFQRSCVMYSSYAEWASKACT
ncbi:MAG: outer membrane protein assembly factor BamD [Kiritimatiellia bacterium]